MTHPSPTSLTHAQARELAQQQLFAHQSCDGDEDVIALARYILSLEGEAQLATRLPTVEQIAAIIDPEAFDKDSRIFVKPVRQHTARETAIRIHAALLSGAATPAPTLQENTAHHGAAGTIDALKATPSQSDVEVATEWLTNYELGELSDWRAGPMDNAIDSLASLIAASRGTRTLTEEELGFLNYLAGTAGPITSAAERRNLASIIARLSDKTETQP